ASWFLPDEETQADIEDGLYRHQQDDEQVEKFQALNENIENHSRLLPLNMVRNCPERYLDFRRQCVSMLALHGRCPLSCSCRPPLLRRGVTLLRRHCRRSG